MHFLIVLGYHNLDKRRAALNLCPLFPRCSIVTVTRLHKSANVNIVFIRTRDQTSPFYYDVHLHGTEVIERNEYPAANGKKVVRSGLYEDEDDGLKEKRVFILFY